jgi:anti-sigma-K factor RskA
MPVLDASKETYQLWIVDDERNEKTPVSGGIFNMSGTGEIIIPINAQLRILKPKQFAVSKEKAGGVVVTKPDRIVAIAKI